MQRGKKYKDVLFQSLLLRDDERQTGISGNLVLLLSLSGSYLRRETNYTRGQGPLPAHTCVFAMFGVTQAQMLRL